MGPTGEVGAHVAPKETRILQPVLFVIGLAIVSVPFLPSIRRWYTVGR